MENTDTAVIYQIYFCEFKDTIERVRKGK